MAFNVRAQIVLQAPTNTQQIVNQINNRFRRGINANINLTIPAAQQRVLNNLNRNLNTTQKNLTSSSKAARSFGDQIGLAARRFSAFVIATTAFVRLTAAFRSSLSDAISFQRELVRVAQVTGESVNNLQRLTKEITRLSTSLGVNSNELLQTSRVLAQTGLSANDTQIALDALAKSTLAPTFGDINKTVEVSIATLRQFNLRAEDLEDTLGSINAISKSFAVESDDLGVAIRRAGGAFSATGGDLEELLALFTSVRATTRESAESIATGFRTIFTRLQRVRTLNFLETLGIDLRTAEGEFVGGFEAIRRLSEGLEGLSRTDPRFSQIIEELGGFRQVSKVIPLIEQFATAERALSVAQKERNSLTEDAETAQQALAVQLQRLREEWQELIRTFANSSSFQAVVQIATDLARALVQVGKSLEPVLPLLTILAGGAIARSVGSFRSIGGDFARSFLNRNEGGGVPGIGSTDTVPAMLTPGEFVLRKSAVQSIGLGTLHNLNRRGFAGFNRGGHVKGVQHFQVGGQVAAGGGLNFNVIALALAGIATLTDSLFKFEGEIKTVVNTLVSAGAQFFLFRQVGASFASVTNTGQQAARASALLAQAQEDVRQSTANFNAALQDSSATIAATQGDNSANARDLRRQAKARKDATKQVLRADEARVKQFQDETQRLNRQIGITTAIFGAVAASASALGSALAQRGAAEIENTRGRSGSGQLVGGRAAQSAAAGVATGAVAGIAIGGRAGPIGAGLGLVGGIIFGIEQGLKEQRDIIDRIRIGESIEGFSNALRNFTEGRISATDQVGRLSSVLANVQRTSLSVGAEARKTVLAQVAAQRGGIEQFLNSLAQSSKTLGDFRDQGEEIIQAYSEIIGLPFDETVQSFEQIIISANKKREVDEAYVQAQERSIQRLAEIADITASVQDAELAMSELIDPIADTKTQFERLDKSGIFDRIGSIRDIDQFDEIAQQIGGIAGPAGALLADEATSIAKAFKRLPSILLEVGRPEGALDPIGNFEKRLNESLGDVPIFIREIIRTRVRSIVGAEGREENLLSKISTDLFGLTDQLLEGLGPIPDSLKAIAESTNNQLNDIGRLFEARVQLEQQFLQSLDNEFTQRLNSEERVAEITDQRLAPGRRQDIDRRRFAVLTSGLNLGGNAVQSLANIVVDAQEQIKIFDRALANSDPKNFTFLADQLALYRTRLDQANKGLKFLADGANRAAPALKELEDVQRDREAIFDIAKTFTFGDAASRRELGVNIASAVAVALRGADAIPGSLRPGALDFLEQIGDVQVGLLGGRSGNDVIRDVTSQQLQGIGLTQQEAQQIVEATPRELQLIEQVTEAGRRAIEASEALTNNIDLNIAELNASIGSRFDEFLTRFEQLLRDSFVDQRKTQVEIARQQLENAQKRGSGANRLRDEFGINDAESVKATRALIPLLRDQAKIAARARTIGEIQSELKGDRSVAQIGQAFQETLDKELNISFERGSGGGIFPASIGELDGNRQADVLDVLRRVLKESDIPQDIINNIIQSTLSSAEGQVGGGFGTLLGGGTTAQGIFDAAFGRGGSVSTELSVEQGKLQAQQEKILDKLLELELSNDTLEDARRNLDSLEEAIKALGEGNIEQLTANIQKAAENLERAEIALDVARKSNDGRTGFASGGFVGGTGSGDIIPAFLEPGEFVLRKSAVKNLGVGFLQNINKRGASKFQNGGLVQTRREILELRRLASEQQRAARIANSIQSNDGGLGFQARREEERQRRRLERTIRAIEAARAGNDLSRVRRTDILPVNNINGSVVANPNGAAQGGGVGTNPASGTPSGATSGTTVGSAGANIAGITTEGLARFNNDITRFVNSANNLAKSLNNFPSQITMTGNHKVEVLINGAEILQRLKPSIAELVTKGIETNINKLIKDKFPSVGADFESASPRAVSTDQ